MKGNAIHAYVILRASREEGEAQRRFAAALGILWLSSRWFFWPAIQKNLLLAFATHNPLTLVVDIPDIEVRGCSGPLDVLATNVEEYIRTNKA